MPELTLENIEKISRDVKKQDITFFNLADQLIDHICCDIENEMEEGLTFYEAYRRVRQNMGPQRLKEIQQETLYATDTKYRFMKNTMKISGVAGTILFGFAVLFKIEHWSGAGFMLTIGALILAFVFMPSALGILWKESHSRNRLLLFISGFLTAMFFIFGIVFKVQHWPDANLLISLAGITCLFCFLPLIVAYRLSDQENKPKRPVYLIGALGIIFYSAGMIFKLLHWPAATFLMVAGLIILSVAAFPWYTWLMWKDEKHISSRFLFIVIGSLAIIIPGALFNLNLQYAYEDGFYPHQQQQQELFKYLNNRNSTMVNFHKDSAGYAEIEKLHSATKDIISLIDDIQVKMVRASEGEPGKPAVADEQILKTENGTEIQYRMLTRPFQPGPVRDFLLPGCTSRKELDKAMQEYCNLISELVPERDRGKYKVFLEPSAYLPGDSAENTEMSLMTGLHALELLKNSLLTIESKIFNVIIKETKSV
jgi:hypothetical protein